MQAARIPERNKLRGVRYAVTHDGIELAVLNVLDAPFVLNPPTDLPAMLERFIAQQRALTRIPRIVRSAMFRVVLRGSVLGTALRRAGGSFLGGLDTYMMKLGEHALPSALVKPVDRRLANALPALSMRMRLVDMARLTADCAIADLGAAPGRPLRFLNIAGGPASDSLNALIVIAAHAPELLVARRIEIVVLDGDDAGPAFGARMLAELSAAAGPLHGIDVGLVHTPYDWRRADDLRPVLVQARASDAITVVSSEGGLFEYGSDDEILANLQVIRSELGEAARVVGSVTRSDEAMRLLRENSPIPTRPRGIAKFADLVAPARYRVARVLEGPLSDQVVLEAQ